jgi:hypothetical protein
MFALIAIPDTRLVQLEINVTNAVFPTVTDVQPIIHVPTASVLMCLLITTILVLVSYVSALARTVQLMARAWLVNGHSTPLPI